MTPNDDSKEPVIVVSSSADKSKLSSEYSVKYSICMIFGFLVNTAMILYSHLGISAVVVSSECPEGFSGCPERIIITNLTGACTEPGDVEIFAPGSFALRTVEYMPTIGIRCLAQQQCMVEEVVEFLGVSETCALCFAESVICPAVGCFNPCVPPNNESPECFECFDDLCAIPLRECTGIFFPPRGNSGRLLQSSDEDCLDKAEFELFKVFNLTFVNSIEESFKGGSIALALFILISSGVWPYMKNIMMIIAWFGPISAKRRGKILTVLAILGRWSLVDVFAVIVIINGVVLNKLLAGNSELIAFTESRLGIYMFGIAALWALLQGEIIRVLSERKHKKIREKGSYGLKDQKEIVKLKVFVILTSLFAIIFMTMGIFSDVLKMELSGRITTFEGPNDVSYNLLEFGTALFSDCALYNGHGSPQGAVFLGILFIVLVILVPLAHSLLLFVFSLKFQFESVKGSLPRWIFLIGNFASLDVFFITMLTVAGQIKGLIEATVGDQVDAQCGVTPEAKEEGIFCISLVGKLQIGAFVLGAAMICHWAAQIGTARLIAKGETFT